MQTRQRIRMPRKPANPAKLQQKWRHLLEALFGEIIQWSESKNWWVHRAERTVDDGDWGGRYKVPMLMIQSPQGRFTVEPVSPLIIGAQGRVDMQAFPTFDRMILLYRDGKWTIKSDRESSRSRPWSREAFFRAAQSLMSPA